jgi:hypothetical protein
VIPGGGRSDICPRDEVFLNIIIGEHGVCIDIQGRIGTHTLRGSGYLGCSSEAWHQGGYVVQGIGIACSGV